MHNYCFPPQYGYPEPVEYNEDTESDSEDELESELPSFHNLEELQVRIIIEKIAHIIDRHILK